MPPLSDPDGGLHAKSMPWRFARPVPGMDSFPGPSQQLGLILQSAGNKKQTSQDSVTCEVCRARAQSTSQSSWLIRSSSCQSICHDLGETCHEPRVARSLGVCPDKHKDGLGILGRLRSDFAPENHAGEKSVLEREAGMGWLNSAAFMHVAVDLVRPICSTRHRVRSQSVDNGAILLAHGSKRPLLPNNAPKPNSVA